MPPKGPSLIAKAKSFLKGAHTFAKKEKLLSKALTYAGQTKLAGIASMAGYGKKRRRRRVRRA